ncbi:MAG: YidC/Oxa1 family membrane protein insertase [Thermoleophilaceae bacterium]|jgi:YidC/Oxa1 family membrane protein insertase
MFVLANVLQPLIDVNESIIKFFHDTVGLGWGPAIIGLTCVIRLAILPLTFKQVRSMQALQRLQPEMKKIQERYKEDKQRMQQELMKFYQEHNFNPLSSCLPLVLQFPFFMSLFYLQRSSEFKAELHAPGSDPGFLNIADLTKPVHGATLVVMLLIYLGTQMASSYVTSVNVQDPTQRRLLFLFPIFFSFIIIRFPAGLIVYWITTNVWTIGQQLFIRKFLPAPEPVPATGSGGGGGGARGKPAPAPALTDGGDGKPEKKGFWARAMATMEQSQAAKAGGDGESRGGGGGRAEPRATKEKERPKASAGPKSGGSKSDGSKSAKNGGPSKAPPSSPRKKKKRSGRRR